MIQFASAVGMLATVKKYPNIIAPNMIIKTIPTVFAVSVRQVIRAFIEKFLLIIMNRSPIIAPMAAASVELKNPANKPPITAQNRTTTGSTPFSD